MLIKSNFMSKGFNPQTAAKIRISEHITKKKDFFVSFVGRKYFRSGQS